MEVSQGLSPKLYSQSQDSSAPRLKESVTETHIPSEPKTVEYTESYIKDENIRRTVLRDITHIETCSSKNDSHLPSEEWIEKHKKYLFQFIGYKRIDKLLNVVQLNLNLWGAPERLTEIMNARNKGGKTPLELAIDWRSPGHIKVFRKYGAEVTPAILEYGERKLPTYIYRELT